MEADNQDVEHASGISRLCGSVACALCAAPLILLGSTLLLGWNERRAVCDAKAIIQGRNEVVEVGCGSAAEGAGELVMFSCDLSKAGLAPLTLAGSISRGSDFQLSYLGTGLEVRAEMYQCVESVSSTTTKDKLGGGTTTVKTYTYRKEWRSSRVNSASFRKRDSENFRSNCGADNPAWPAGLPANGVRHAPRVSVGAFTIEGEYVAWVPLTAPVLAAAVPFGWTLSGTEYRSDKYSVASMGPSADIGRVRVSFKGTDWDHPGVTVLGLNSAGAVGRWTADPSWLCAGFTLADLRAGSVDKEALFKALKSASSALTYVLRFLGFCLLWFAFSLLAGPLEVVADCVPCVGPFLGDGVRAIACCVSCLPGCSCALGVIGVVWVAMRPMVGVPLLLVFFGTCCGFAGYRMHARQGEGKEGLRSSPQLYGLEKE